MVRAFLDSDEVETTSEVGGGQRSVTTEPLRGLEAGGTQVLTVVVLDEEVVHADAVLVVGTESS